MSDLLCLFQGKYVQETTNILISDPILKFDDNEYQKMSIWIKNAAQGNWNTWIIIDEDNIINKSLISCFENTIKYGDKQYLPAVQYLPNNHNWEKYHRSDLAYWNRIGIYDLKYYQDNNNIGKYSQYESFIGVDEKWYLMNRIIASNFSRGGVLPNGVVSDVGYCICDVYLEKSNEGNIIGIKIDFIDEIYDHT